MIDKQIQLFLLPYAGGSSFSFFKVNRFLDKRIETIPVEYTGRGARSSEKLINTFEDCLKDVSSQINKYRKQTIPYAVLGYSLGSVLAYDLLRKHLIDGEFPKHVFFCAEGSLKKLSEENKKSNYAEEGLFDTIKKLGGFSKSSLKNPEALQDIYPLIKNDFFVYRKYEYYYYQFNFDISIINSSNDFSAVNLEDWKSITTKKTDYYELGDNHFFINEKYSELADIINKKLIAFLN